MRPINHLLGALAVMSLLGCSRDEQINHSYDNDPNAVVVTASVLGTKVNTEAAGDTFTEGDIFMVENTSEGIREYRSKAKYQYSGGAWKLVGEQYMHWADGYNYFQAWMPAGAAYNAFTIPADQSSVAGLRSADWMTAAVNGVEKTKNQSIDLEFSHKLAKVVVTVTEFKAPYTSEEAITNVRFALATQGVSGEISIADGASEIAAYISDKSMSAVLAPGTYEAGKTFLTLNVGSDALTVEAPQAGIALESGKSYKFTLTVENNRPRISSVTVNDWNEVLLEGVETEEEIWGVTVMVPDNEIWYKTTGGIKERLTIDENDIFDANIVEHVYEDGKWIIRFDNTLKSIELWAGLCPVTITEFRLPDSVESINALDINSTIKVLHIPKNLKYVQANIYLDCLAKFKGYNISKDGRCIIINSALCFFIGSDIEEYTIPEGVVTISQNAFRDCYLRNSPLKKIIIPEGVVTLEPISFCGIPYLEEVSLPNSLCLNELSFFIFKDCPRIKKFYGPDKFVSEDGLCFYFYDECVGLNVMHKYASGSDISEYIIPEGIEAIEDFSFEDSKSLCKLTFPSTLTYPVTGTVFLGCDNLDELYRTNTSTDHKSLIIDGKLCFIAGKNLKEYVLPEEVTVLGNRSFANCEKLEKLTMTDNVESVDKDGYIFGDAGWARGVPYNLKEITISARMKDLGLNPFTCNTSIEVIYCRAIIPPTIEYKARNDIETDHSTNLKIYVPKQSLEIYKSRKDWEPYRKYLVGYEYTDLPELDIDYYYSTDYSHDGRVTTIQTAIDGNGVDLILMGDAFSDRQIADGTYRAAMDKAIEAIFSEEPYKSYRDLFNIHIVDVVSLTEGYDNPGQSLSTWFGDGTSVGGNDNLAMDYALKAITEEKMDEALIVVMMNRDYYAGTCYMYYPSSGNYGNGTSVAYFPTSSDEATFAGLMLHEAGGHGFAKLDDEYAYENMGAFPESEVAHRRTLEGYGWWKNTDLTNDVNIVKWAHFLVDERYQYDGLGVFEGASTYWTGAWRPTENSIMRHNTDGFNAPSREAIYTRIHKLAYGEDWEYDHEDFVAYDEINRKTAEDAASAQARPQNIAPWRPTTPPVVVGKTWREAMEEAKM